MSALVQIWRVLSTWVESSMVAMPSGSTSGVGFSKPRRRQKSLNCLLHCRRQQTFSFSTGIIASPPLHYSSLKTYLFHKFIYSITDCRYSWTASAVLGCLTLISSLFFNFLFDSVRLTVLAPHQFWGVHCIFLIVSYLVSKFHYIFLVGDLLDLARLWQVFRLFCCRLCCDLPQTCSKPAQSLVLSRFWAR